MTQGFILCDKGFEKTVFADTQLVLGKEMTPTFIERGFFFETDDLLDFVTLSYKSQSALRVMVPLLDIERTDAKPFDTESLIETITKELDLESLKFWLDEEYTFKVEVSDILKSFDSQLLAQKVGAHIHLTAHIPADMKNPSTKILIIATENHILMGIDFSHTMLSKREYKMFNTPTALRATIAYNLAFESGAIEAIYDLQDPSCAERDGDEDETKDFEEDEDDIDSEDEYLDDEDDYEELDIEGDEEVDVPQEEQEELVILDPFCGSGTIPIEIALTLKNHSPRFFQTEQLGFWKYKPFTKEQLEEHLRKITKEKPTHIPVKILGYDIQTKAVDSTKKNAKIAGVNKAMKLARVDIDWIDTKFIGDKQVNYIITVPPYFTQHHPISKIQKVYTQFFNRIKEVLAQDGVIVFLTNNAPAVIETISEEFVLVEQKTIWMGKDEYELLKISRS